MKRPLLPRAVAIVVLVAIAGVAAWRYDVGTRPEAVQRRFGAALAERDPGTSIEKLDGDMLRVTTPSGVYVDVQLPRLTDACRDDRFGCSSLMEHALDDVRRAEASTRAPSLEELRPMLVAELSPGFRFGYVTEPLIGSLEIRYALVSGIASTFVTAAIADRLGLAAPALKAAALAKLRGEGGVDLVRVESSPPDTPLYRVKSDGDPPASLLDRERMQHFARRLDATRLLVALPAPGTLYLAAAGDATFRSLEALLVAARQGKDARPGEVPVLAYDPTAPEGSALSTASRTR